MPVLVAIRQYSKELAHGVHSAGWAIDVLRLDPNPHADASVLVIVLGMFVQDVPKLRVRISASTRKVGRHHSLCEDLLPDEAGEWLELRLHRSITVRSRRLPVPGYLTHRVIDLQRQL